MQEVMRSLVPVQMEVAWGTFSGVVGSLATFLFGAWNEAIQALAMLMLIDYITGVLAAYMKPRTKLSSKKGLRGIIKKLVLILFVASAHFLDLATGQAVFCTLITYTIIGNEGLSIVENCSYCGVPVPSILKNKLEQLAQEQSERAKGAKGE